MTDFESISLHLRVTQTLLEEGNTLAAKHAFQKLVEIHNSLDEIEHRLDNAMADAQLARLEVSSLLDERAKVLSINQSLEHRLKETLELARNHEKTIAKSEKKSRSLVLKNEQQSERIRELESDNRTLRAMSEQGSGEVLGKLQGKNGISYELRLFWEGFRYKVARFDGTRLIQDLPFHFKLYASNGLSADVRFTETGTGILPPCEELAVGYPGKEGNAMIHALFLKQAAHLPNGIVDYIRALKQHYATTLDWLTPEQKKGLQKAKKINYFDVLSTTLTTFRNDMVKSKLNDEDLNQLYAGIQAEAEKIRSSHLTKSSE